VQIISHRGNLNGSIPEMENRPDYILSAIRSGFSVEVDVWYVDGNLKLGHDLPQYDTSIGWLRQRPLWCHAKNAGALEVLLFENMHCFWHEQDSYTLTSQGIPWCYPGHWMAGGVTVVQDKYEIANKIVSGKNIFGICVEDPNAWN